MRMRPRPAMASRSPMAGALMTASDAVGGGAVGSASSMGRRSVEAALGGVAAGAATGDSSVPPHADTNRVAATMAARAAVKVIARDLLMTCGTMGEP